MTKDNDTPSGEIIPFDFDEQAVRVVMRDGAPWFIAADVCRVLDLGNPSQAVSRLDEDELTLISNEGQTGQRGGARSYTIISESGLYALVLTSRKPEAKRFRKWITAEVLPTLRKTGSYTMPNVIPLDEAPDMGLIRTGEYWLSLIREARMLGGRRAGRAMWARSPLPPLVPVMGAPPEPEHGQACLDHLMAFASVTTQIRDALTGDEAAHQALTAMGLRVKPGGLFVANGNHPGVLGIFESTIWANGNHRAALLSVPGAQSSDGVYTLGGISCRGVVVPLHATVLREVAYG